MVRQHLPHQRSRTERYRFENTYPGVRCDIPAHVYQSGFSPNTQWTEEFAQGHEIRAYWQGLARKYDVYKYLRFQQQIKQAVWISNQGKWKVTIEDLREPGKVGRRGSHGQMDQR